MPLKVELHAHSSDDPHDFIPHTSHALIDRAAALGYEALAITLHDKQLDLAQLRDYAAARGVVLIPGIERTIAGRHVLLLNFSTHAEAVSTFEEVIDLKRRDPGIVVAPHPFFPHPSCLGALMDRHADAIDAVELNGMYVRGANFNRRAIDWAAQHHKPMVGNGDVHRLGQLGTTYSLVDAEPDAQSICDAIRAGRVTVRTQPLPWWRAGALLGAIFTADLWMSVRRGTE